MEPKTWVILTTRWGENIRSPEPGALRVAVREVYQECTEGITEADYEEHPNAWLRYGFDEGPMFVLDVYRNGTVVFDQWVDQDFRNRLAPESSTQASEELALDLWIWLAAGEIGRVKRAFGFA